MSIFTITSIKNNSSVPYYAKHLKEYNNKFEILDVGTENTTLNNLEQLEI